MRRDYAVLVSLATREEAEVAASALRADGIDAFVGNAHHAAMEWWLTPALGGAQIMVPASALGDARTKLKARVADWKQEPVFDRARRRNRWREWTMIVWLFAPALLAWLLWALWPR